MIKTLNVVAVLALIGSAIAAYSVKYETILMAEKLKKREGERGREQHAIAVLKAEWHLLNRPERLAKIAPPEQGMQMLSVRQIVRAIDVPQMGLETDTIAKALDGTLTGSLAPSPVTPDPTRKSTGRTPVAPLNKVNSPSVAPSMSKKVTASPMPLGSRPLGSRPLASQSLASQPLGSQSSSPMRLTSGVAGSKAGNTAPPSSTARPATTEPLGLLISSVAMPAPPKTIPLPPKNVPLSPKSSPLSPKSSAQLPAQ